MDNLARQFILINKLSYDYYLFLLKQIEKSKDLIIELKKRGREPQLTNEKENLKKIQGELLHLFNSYLYAIADCHETTESEIKERIINNLRETDNFLMGLKNNLF